MLCERTAMAHIPESFVQEVLSRTDIVDVISSYVSLQKKGGRYFGLCPFHGEKTASFSVSGSQQLYYCFGCHAGGNVVSFIENYENASFVETIEMLADRLNMSVPYEKGSSAQKAKSDRRSIIQEMNREAANFYYAQLLSPAGERAMNYLKDRGLTDETIRKFGLGYSLPGGNSLYNYLKSKGFDDGQLKMSGLVMFSEDRGPYDRFFNRVMFPIQDASKHVIGFGGRVMGNAEPKYLNSPETEAFDKSRNLYGLHLARSSRREGLILCEGYMDVISMHQAGFDNAVATLGTALTGPQSVMISKYGKQLLLCYDSDNAGVKAALRAMPILKRSGVTSRIIHMEPYKDPDEFIKSLGAEAFEERIGDAQNGFMFMLDIHDRDFDLEDPQGYTDCVNSAAHRVAGISDEIERVTYIKAVSERYAIEESIFKKKVDNIGLSGKAISDEAPGEPVLTGMAVKEGIEIPQNILLSLLADYPEHFKEVKDNIKPSEFEGELYQKVADMLYAGLESGRASPALILTRFEGEEEKRKVAQMFGGTNMENSTQEDIRIAIKEAMMKIKAHAAANIPKEESGNALQKAIENQKIKNRLRSKK